MTKFLLRRSLGAIVVMWAVATLVFFMLRAVPGAPGSSALSNRLTGTGGGLMPPTGILGLIVAKRANGQLAALDSE